MSVPFKSGDEILVKQTATSLLHNSLASQFNSSVTALSDGRFAVIWTVALDTDVVSVSEVHAQILNAHGSKAGGEIVVSTTPSSLYDYGEVTALADGKFVVTWISVDYEEMSPIVYAVSAQIINPDGSKAGPEIQVNTTTGGLNVFHTVSTLSDGRFVVSWAHSTQNDDDPSGYDIKAQFMNPDGSKSGSEFLIKSNAEAFEWLPDISPLPDGRFIITWMDIVTTGGDTSLTSIRAQIFNADGSPVSEEFLVNTTTIAVQFESEVTELADGRFAITWTDEGESTDENMAWDVRAQVFNADGSKFGNEIHLGPRPDSNQALSSITTLSDGRFVITWLDANSTGEYNTNLRAQVFDADGNRIGAEFLIDDEPYAVFDAAEISTLADGRIAVTWKELNDDDPDNPDLEIRAQIFDPRVEAVSVTGSTLGDDYVGTGFDDMMAGLVGEDHLVGRGGDDELRGGAGNDYLGGGRGNDRMWGGGGDDLMRGAAGDDRLYGGKGNDFVAGGVGNDVLIGADGDDQLRGKDGDDRIVGANGVDRMIGGDGADTFVFNAVTDSGATNTTRDVIKDFDQAEGDIIDLSNIDAGSDPGDQAFAFVGNAAFSSTEGEVRFFQTAMNTIVQGDIDGDGLADFEVLLNGVIDLTAGDFLL